MHETEIRGQTNPIPEAHRIILVADSGADLPEHYVRTYNIHIIPMYVQMGGKTWKDREFPPEQVVDYYVLTSKTPKTSAPPPFDFSALFDKLHQDYPDSNILYLAYSAVTTSTFQSAVIAAEGRSYVHLVDTKQCSIGQGAVVLQTAQWMQEHPSADVSEVIAQAKAFADHTAMCFVPDDLAFLKAGGRVTNAEALLGSVLNIHPVIQIIDGRLKVTMKLRGSMKKVLTKLFEQFLSTENLNAEKLYLMRTPGLREEVQAEAEQLCRKHHIRSFEWIDTGCVITCHGGPRAFGITGFRR